MQSSYIRNKQKVPVCFRFCFVTFQCNMVNVQGNMELEWNE